MPSFGACTSDCTKPLQRRSLLRKIYCTSPMQRRSLATNMQYQWPKRILYQRTACCHNQGGKGKEGQGIGKEDMRIRCDFERRLGTWITQYWWHTSHALLAIEANRSESVVVPNRFTICA